VSFDHWWLSGFLTPEDEARFAPQFAAAVEKAVMSPEGAAALRLWQAQPDVFTDTCGPGLSPAGTGAAR